MSENNILPYGWCLTRLGDIGDYTNGKAFNEAHWSVIGRPIIRIQDLTGKGSR